MQIKSKIFFDVQRKKPLRVERLRGESLRSSAWMSRVVRGALERPEVSVHRLLTSRRVALGDESRLIGIDLAHVLFTSCYRCLDCRKTLTDQELVCRRQGLTLDHRPQVKAVTIGVGRRCRTVRTKQHLLTAVLSTLTGFTQCTGYIVYSGTPSYFCHDCSAFGSPRRGRE